MGDDMFNRIIPVVVIVAAFFAGHYIPMTNVRGDDSSYAGTLHTCEYTDDAYSYDTSGQ